MKYSTLTIGKNKEEIKLSKLGLGTMRFPEKDGEIDQEKVDEMIKYAFDNGINYFDTAYVYTGSEVSLGKAIKQLNREDFYIADKMPYWGIDSEEYLEKTFNESLERLQTDYIDFYLMHSLSKSVIDKMKQYKGIEYAKNLKAQGKIKYLGFSIHDDYETLLEILDLADWDFVQIQYNYLDLTDAPGQKGYDELVKRNIPIIIMEPLKGGILSDLPEKLAMPYKELGGSNVSYAFRWLAEQSNVEVILSGMGSLEQLKENIEIFSDLKPLSEEEHNAIIKVKDNILKFQKVPCTGCRYCVPCPVGVQIPNIFKAWNTKAMQEFSDGWVSGGVIDFDSAASCIDCKVCMEHCPQRIDIPNKLAQVVSEKE